MPAPRVVADHYSIKVYFGDVLHVHVKRSAFLGLQSWSDGPHHYSIEFSLTDGFLTVEYDDAENWRAILGALDRLL